MIDTKRTKYILHVSDFHLSSDTIDFAVKALKCLSDKLDEKEIPIDYLIHTGDVIDSKNAHLIAANQLSKKEDTTWVAEYVNEEEFDEEGFKNDTRTTDKILTEINDIVQKMRRYFI